MVARRTDSGSWLRQARTFLFCALFLSWLPTAAFGQPAGIIQERDRQQRELQERERQSRERFEKQGEPLMQAEPTPAPTPEQGAALFDLTKVETNPSEILSPLEIEAVVSEYEGRKVGIDDLNEIVKRINQLYADKGFAITAMAMLPKQKIQGGVVRIQLVEARLGALTFTGNRHTSEWFLRQRIHAPIGELANLENLVPQLQRTNRLNDIFVTVSPKRGAEPGTTDYIIEVKEPRQYFVDLTTDNYLSENSGSLRAGMNLGIASLLGMRDPVSVGAFGGENFNSVYGSYSIPITPWDTRLTVSGDYSESDTKTAGRCVLVETGTIINGVRQTRLECTEGATFTSEAIGASGQLSHPLFVSQTFLMRAFVEGAWRDEDLKVGSMLVAESDTTSAYGGISGDWSDPLGSWTYYHRFGHVFRHHLNGADFYKYSGSISRFQPIVRPNVYATWRLQGQLTSSEKVPSAEVLVAGGGQSVRGYPEFYRVGQDGYVTQLQLNAIWPRPIKTGEGDTSQLGGFLFLDHASLFSGTTRTVRNNTGVGPSTVVIDETLGTYLAGTGGGVNLTWNDWLRFEVAVGLPLSERDNISDAQVHFALHLTPPVSRWIDG